MASVLIEGVLFRARYLGSTQLACEGQPTKATRMLQAEEAVSRIKVGFYYRHTYTYIRTVIIFKIFCMYSVPYSLYTNFKLI